MKANEINLHINNNRPSIIQRRKREILKDIENKENELDKVLILRIIKKKRRVNQVRKKYSKIKERIS